MTTTSACLCSRMLRTTPGSPGPGSALVCAEISLAGEVAVVTGVCRRLGPVWATALLDAGASVVGIDIRAEATQQRKGVDPEALVGQYLGIQADVTDRPSLRRATMTHAD